MNLIEVFHSYIHYLIHPFKTHESFMYPEKADGYLPLRMSAYESLSISWLFIVVNAIFRMITLNFAIVFIMDLFSATDFDYSSFIDLNEFPSMYFIVLSAALDIIFFPLFGFFIIQFWEVVIKLFASLLDVSGDLTDRAQDIISVYYSSHILKLIPIFGAPLQSLASMVLMYAGLRRQLNASPTLSVCIILMPFFLMLLIACIFALVFMISAVL